MAEALKREAITNKLLKKGYSFDTIRMALKDKNNEMLSLRCTKRFYE